MKRWRRERLRRKEVLWTARLLALAVLALLVYGFVIEPARLVQRDYALQLPDWPGQCEGLRLDVVSDIHTGSPRNGIENLDRIVHALIASDSDAVLMAGDYVILSVFMGKYVDAATIAEHLKPLTARKPVYAVLGNHDWWKNGPEVSARFAAAGVHMIDNQAVAATLRGCRLWFVGLGDLLEGKPDVAAAFGQVRDDAPVVALTHEPDLWPRIPVRASLSVAGHTHGRQIIPWPFWLGSEPGSFVQGSSRLRGWFREDGREEGREGERNLFVTPGIGTSIVPMRLGVPPEISRLTLRSQPQASP